MMMWCVASCQNLEALLANDKREQARVYYLWHVAVSGTRRRIHPTSVNHNRNGLLLFVRGKLFLPANSLSVRNRRPVPQDLAARRPSVPPLDGGHHRTRNRAPTLDVSPKPEKGKPQKENACTHNRKVVQSRPVTTAHPPIRAQERLQTLVARLFRRAVRSSSSSEPSEDHATLARRGHGIDSFESLSAANRAN